MIRRFIKDEGAGTLVMTAVLFPMILGFGGLGLDVTGWYMQKRDVQNLVDMAAIEAVHTGNYYSGSGLADKVNTFLTHYGLNASTDTVTFNSPPTSGDYVGKNGFMEVIISRKVTLNFLSAFYGLSGNNLTVNVAARAVAGTLIIGTQCIVALDKTADRALEFSGSAEVVAECGVASNSTSGQSIYVGGNASLTADPAMAVGDIVVSGSATLVTNSPLQTFAQPTKDPYANLPIPPISACDVTGATTVNNDQVMTPGRYCGDINVKGSNVTFEPGTYVIDGGSFIANAGAQFAGNGVTFILTGDTPSDVGTVSINGGSKADLVAPTSGDYEGILVYQDPKADYRTSTGKFLGGADLLFDGVIYMPSSDIQFSGGAASDPSCMQIFGATVTFEGSSTVGNSDAICQSLNMDVSPQIRIQLVE
ncbi:TadE/TadG family type IV pilus assembly protein [Kordiimonas marina]|uniref:TadE/TadG family type IV pilus assembly protein n=1 Tax=Kordiimonas marina TaxID=2872312 RepID=UPI001FF17EFE|nr:pilus assembly protein TadG-related protein [Kordiimonas marina]MCJ9428594.1 hypothetical protein [Kordiimonas marina]